MSPRNLFFMDQGYAWNIVDYTNDCHITQKPILEKRAAQRIEK
jgi:hypothetical protein